MSVLLGAGTVGIVGGVVGFVAYRLGYARGWRAGWLRCRIAGGRGR